MALSYQAKFQMYNSETQKSRTITIGPLLEVIDTDNAITTMAQKLQPLVTDSITAYSVVRTRKISDALGVNPGEDVIVDSTKDSTIFKMSNDTGSKLITISNSASAVESDTTQWAAFADAVYEFGDELSTYLIGDYGVEDVTLRAIYDTQVEQ